MLDHIGLDVKNHAAFVKKIEAEGIKLDEPVRKTSNGNTITYITDPWGTPYRDHRTGAVVSLYLPAHFFPPPGRR